MKALLLALIPLSAFASPARDAILGTYRGENGCYLRIAPVANGETDVTFTDSMSDRTLWGVGRSLEAQLATPQNQIALDHFRQGLGDVTAHVVITLEDGVPASMRGTVDGWGHALVDCTFESREAP